MYRYNLSSAGKRASTLCLLVSFLSLVSCGPGGMGVVLKRYTAGAAVHTRRLLINAGASNAAEVPQQEEWIDGTANAEILLTRVARNLRQDTSDQVGQGPHSQLQSANLEPSEDLQPIGAPTPAGASPSPLRYTVSCPAASPASPPPPPPPFSVACQGLAPAITSPAPSPSDQELLREAGGFTNNVNYYGIAVVDLYNLTSPEDCFMHCVEFNEEPGQFCDNFVFCNNPMGCRDRYSSADANKTFNPFGGCVLQAQGVIDATVPLAKRTIPCGTDYGSGVYVAPGKLEEIAQNGNFQLFRDYTGGGDPLQAPNVITRLNTMADTYLECYQKCKDYNIFPYQACNVFSFCAKMTDCTDGYVLPVPFKTCRLGFQGNLTSPDQAPLAFKNGTQQDAECLNQIALDVNQQIVPTVGAGVFINTTEVGLYQAAGLFNATSSYQGSLVKHSNASSALDCYNQCKAFNDLPGQSCNVFIYCGRPEGCDGGYHNNTSEFRFGLCDLKTQPGLTNTSIMPATNPIGNQTTLGSGVYINSTLVGSLTEAGNFTFSVEYNGTILGTYASPTPMDCWKRCKDTKDCNIFSYCPADPSLNCYRGNYTVNQTIPAHSCILKSQDGLDATSPLSTLATAALSNMTSLGSGVYVGSPPGPNHTGAIIGGVVGGVVGLTLASLLLLYIRKRHADWRLRKNLSAGIADGGDGGGKEQPSPMYTKQLLMSATDFSNTDSSEFDTAELVGISEIPKQTTGSLYLPMESSGQTTILRAESADRTATVVFEGEEPTTEIAEWRTPDTQNQDDLEEIWRIAPRDLQCKLNSCGELIKLGIGAGGSVFFGLMLKNTDVAIKVVDSPTPKQQRSFVKEILMLKACHHPNIIQFLGASIEADRTLLVMEYMHGGDLLSQIRHDDQGMFKWHKWGRSIALDVARGLTYLHSHDILHLDIKSPNILLNKSLSAKISDIGLGRIVKKDATTAMTYGASVPWCAPEQLRGEPCSTATDIFALGTVLWELCTGEVPNVQRNYRRPMEKEAPRDIATLIDACHALDPKDRPVIKAVHDVIQASRV